VKPDPARGVKYERLGSGKSAQAHVSAIQTSRGGGQGAHASLSSSLLLPVTLDTRPARMSSNGTTKLRHPGKPPTGRYKGLIAAAPECRGLVRRRTAAGRRRQPARSPHKSSRIRTDRTAPRSSRPMGQVAHPPHSPVHRFPSPSRASDNQHALVKVKREVRRLVSSDRPMTASGTRARSH